MRLPTSRPKKATRGYHPATQQAKRARGEVPSIFSFQVPEKSDEVEVRLGNSSVRLTNLRKLFWPRLGITKGDLIQYYADVAAVLLPHLADRAMVMKRYPNGVTGDFFFMKRAPSPRPPWIAICSIEHASGNVIDFPVIRDLLSLLWVINLGCIDLNPWYARCDDVDRPDYLHFDLDPFEGATWEQLVEAALIARDALSKLRFPTFVKTTGSRGLHIYVPIVRGPTQKEVWNFARELARTLASLRPDLITAEYRIAKRPRKRIVIDYNQNAWGRTLASVYSVRPQPKATVSAPVTWKELEQGAGIEDFRIDNMRQRIKQLGDLWAPLLKERRRVRLEKFYGASA